MSQSELTKLERHALGALMTADGGVEQCTVTAIASRTGATANGVQRALEQLDSIEPKLVHRHTDARSGGEFWSALEPVIVALQERREVPPPRQRRRLRSSARRRVAHAQPRSRYSSH